MRRIRQSLHRIRSCRRDAWASRDGAAGVEFAILAPLLLVMVAGVVDLGHALNASRKTSQIAATVADLVADDNEWTSEDVNKLLAASGFLLQPYGTAKLSVVLTLESVDANGTVTVAKSLAYQGTPAGVNGASPVPVPAPIKKAGIQIVLAQATYTIKTPFSGLWSAFIGPDGYKFSRYAFARPRRSDAIVIN